MIPLIKIRFAKVKQHPAKSIFQFFSPAITTLLLVIIKLILQKQLINNKGDRSQPAESFSLSDQTFDKELNLSKAAIICNNQTLRNNFIAFLEEKSLLDDELEVFDDYSKFEDYIFSDNYTKAKIFKKVLQIEETDNNTLNYKVMDDNFKPVEVRKSFDMMINEPGFQVIDMEDKYKPNKALQFAFYDRIMASFLMKKYAKTPKDAIIEYKTLRIQENRTMFSDEQFIILLPFFLVIFYYSTLFNFTLWMVGEKEKKLIEFLFRQGINKTNYFFSWILTFLVFTLPCTFANALLIGIAMTANPLLNTILLFGFLLLFSLDIFAMAFFFNSILEKVSTGQTVLKAIYIGSMFAAVLLDSDKITLLPKVFLGFFPQVNEFFFLEAFFKADNFETGFDSYLFKTPYHNISLLVTTILKVVDIFFYSFLGAFIMGYKNSGLEFGEYVQSFFTKVEREIVGPLSKESEETLNFKGATFNENHQEPSQKELNMKSRKEFLNIIGVVKQFDQVRAVDGFNGEIYNDEIFCLLGHNGAGKTTLIRMISGSEEVTEGDIQLNGISLIINKDYLYSNIGVCNQEDIFFEDLTVEEHLKYMTEIKGQKANKEEILQLVDQIGLAPFLNSFCKNLSGGNKRKLCIALALIGSSKLILLDEPTSGMDVFAKRDLWKFLKGYKQNKIIILTTHSLDEAEYLGDRIGIMSEGKYICSGTSSFLKSVYPCGFNLNLLINSKIFTASVKENLLRELKAIDPSAVVKIDSKCTYSVNFMSANEDTNKIFTLIEEKKAEYGIENYTVSSTTLEDVFIKLNNNEISKNMNKGITSMEKSDSSANERAASEHLIDVNEVISRKIGFVHQLKANFKKDIVSLWRNKINFILEILTFVIIIGLTAFIFKYGNKQVKGYQNADEIIIEQPIYFYTNDPVNYGKDFLEKSFYYQNNLKGKTVLRDLDLSTLGSDINNISEVDNYIYDHSKYHNERSYLIILKQSDSTLKVYNLYHFMAQEYFQPAMNLFLSAFMAENVSPYNSVNFIREFTKVDKGINDSLDAEAADKILMIFMLLFIFYAIGSLNGYLMGGPIRERVNNIKHCYYLSGGNMLAYWISLYIIDIIKMLFFLLIILPLILYLGSSSDYDTGYYVLLIIPFIFSSTLFVYFLSFGADKEEDGQKIYQLITIFVGFFLPLANFIIMGYAFENLEDFVNPDKIIFTLADILPNSALFSAMLRVAILPLSSLLGQRFINLHYGTVITNAFVIQLIHVVIFGFLLYLAETRVFGRCINSFYRSQAMKETEPLESVRIGDKLMDSESNNYVNLQGPLIADIQGNSNINPSKNPGVPQINIQPNQTAMRVKSEQIAKIQSSGNLTTKIVGLSKTFTKMCRKGTKAVNDLYLGLEKNEKFGLLGFNGSGKTTTFKSITNSIFYEKGDIYLFGYNTQSQFNTIRNSMGYCPQENNLFEQLTVSETLAFYKDLKMVTESVEAISSRFGLAKFLNTKSKNLSGGNKRKLTFAVALMHYPKVLLLDEPSTGVDPESRRVMWMNINQLGRGGNQYNMILSTHSMEEAEILCDTVGWLKQGSFMCLGNPEQLKLQFSAGYKLHIKFLNSESFRIEENEFNFVRQSFIYYGGDAGFFDNVTARDPRMMEYTYKLCGFLKVIEKKCTKIRIENIGQDGSFEVNLDIIPEHKGSLFGIVLGIKSSNNDISEISLNMDSLENILTNFQ